MQQLGSYYCKCEYQRELINKAVQCLDYDDDATRVKHVDISDLLDYCSVMANTSKDADFY